MTMAYHYTTCQHASAILKSGFILPSTLHVPAGEKPVVWFSRNRTWEPTASKGLMDPRTGWSRTATFPEMVRVGIARFGMDADLLIPWGGLPAAAGMGRAVVEGLVRAGRKVGANPRDWFASLDPVPITGMVMDIYENGAWPSGLLCGEAA